jgi:hypothetical protein
MSDSDESEGIAELSDFDNIEDEFPGIKFSVFIPRSSLDTIVANRDILSIRYVFDCHCYLNNPRKTEFYLCKKQTKGITNRDLIWCLVNNKFDPQCNHIFLENFDLNTEAQVTPWFGS